MKLIHLSDLHLGKKVNEFSMINDQEYIIKEILEIIKEQQPDGVIVAGDVFDRNVPSEDAIKLWDEFLISLSNQGIPVFAISGNHDSAVRFAEHSALMESNGIYFSPKFEGEVKVCKLQDDYGELNIYLMPFVKPADVRRFYPDVEINDYTDAVKAIIDGLDIDTEARNVLVAHQFVTGAVRCESEEITVGGLDNVDASVFDVFDYVALGHIHGKQKIERDTVRYCGTPLKYSFSEKDHVKCVSVVDIKSKENDSKNNDSKGSASKKNIAKCDIDINEVALTPMHDMREIKGSYEELVLKDNYEGTATDDYIHAVLTDEDDIMDAINKLRVIYPNIMKLSYDNTRTRTKQDIEDAGSVEEKSPLELFAEFFEKQNNQPMSQEQEEFITEQIESIWKN